MKMKVKEKTQHQGYYIFRRFKKQQKKIEYKKTTPRKCKDINDTKHKEILIYVSIKKKKRETTYMMKLHKNKVV